MAHDNTGKIFANLDDTDLLFGDDDKETVSACTSVSALEPWLVLVVDDEPGIHAITEVVLVNNLYNGHPIKLLSAYSAKEAKEILQRESNIAVVLLDVVMETDQAGLQLVRWIREELGNRQVRIILRTGEPGQAPERQVIIDYHINDYKAKTELTADKLFLTVLVAIRSYEDMQAIERSRCDLEKLLDSANALMHLRSASYEILQLSLQPLPLKEMLSRALDIVLAIPWMATIKRGVIFLYNETTNQLELVVQKQFNPQLFSLCQTIPLGYCLCGLAAASGEVVISTQIDDRHAITTPDMTPHGHYCVPILLNQHCLGVLNVYLPPNHLCKDEEVDFLKHIANTIAGLLSRHKAEQKIAQLSRALEQSPIAVIITDTIGNIEYINQRFTTLTGYLPQDLIGRSVMTLKVGDDTYTQQIFHNILSHGFDWSGELQGRKKTGELFWEFLSLSPMVDTDQQITNYIFISADITDKKELEAARDQLLTTLDTKVVERTQELNRKIEELEETRQELIAGAKMASLGRLVAGFAHEINTPIGICVSTISSIPPSVAQLEQMLAQDEIDETELNTCLAHLRKNATLGLYHMRRAADLVTRFKRTSVDQASEQKRYFDVKETVHDIVVSLHSTFSTSKIAIQLDGPDELVVFSHPGSLGQIFTNLLLNSFKHGFDNGQRDGTIQIRFSTEGSPPNHLHFWYWDNGRGIKPAHMEKIFEPFFTTARESGGSGLGMFLVYNIVTEQLKGKIDISSVIGEGTEFYFHFSVCEEEELT